MQICFEKDSASKWHLAKTLQCLCTQPCELKTVKACFPNSLVKRLLSCLWSPTGPLGVKYLIPTGKFCLSTLFQLRRVLEIAWESRERDHKELRCCLWSQKFLNISSSWVNNLSALLATQSTICNHRQNPAARFSTRVIKKCSDLPRVNCVLSVGQRKGVQQGCLVFQYSAHWRNFKWFLFYCDCDARAKTAAESVSNKWFLICRWAMWQKSAASTWISRRKSLFHQHQHAEQLLPGHHHQRNSPRPLYSTYKLIGCIALVPSLPTYLFRLLVFTNSSTLLCGFYSGVGWQQRGDCGPLSSPWPQNSC